MSKKCYQLVFCGVPEGTDTARILPYLQKDLDLSQSKLQHVINNSPCVLQNATDIQVAEMTRLSLAALGCIVTCEPAVIYPHVAFAITQRDERIIKKEMSKAQRARTSLLLMCIRFDPDGSRPDIRSLLEPLEEQIDTQFRESDTILVIDESRLIVLGFATDQVGAEIVKKKALKGLANLLGSDVPITVGYCLFPHEGQTIEELLYTASKRKEAATAEPLSNHIMEPVTAAAAPDDRESTLESSHLKICFRGARGTILERLLSLDARTIWSGLSQIPQMEQQRFLAGLPVDSVLSAELEGLIATRDSFRPEPADDQPFMAIFSQLDLDSDLLGRVKLHQEVMAKLSCYEELPTLPSVATQIYSIASDPLSSASELADIIMNDPALTSKLLKTVNSAFYGSPQQISSVKQAVVLLGMDEIVGIAFGLAAAKVFNIKAAAGPIDPKQLWRHSVDTALVAQHLCSKTPQFRTMGAFTAGLLHDVGKIFLIENFPEEYRLTICGNPGSRLPLFEFEEELFGLNHAAIGKLLSAEWNLPEPLVQAITYHHRPLEAASHGGFAAMIGLADYLSHMARSSVAATPAPWLTVGHRECLIPIYTNLTAQTLDDMTVEIAGLIAENEDYLADSH